MSDAAIEAIRGELKRLQATKLDVGLEDAIYVKDHGDGFASLNGSVRRSRFHWFGSATEILERLSELPAGSGPEAIRLEFA